MDEEELDSCTGEELFKQLLRLLPTADVQDYFKNGVWQDVILKLDCRILIGHRQEAGAPEVPALDEVVMPETMPQAKQVPVAVAKPVGPQAVVNVLAKAKAKAVTLLKTPGLQRVFGVPAPKAVSSFSSAAALSSALKPAVIPSNLAKSMLAKLSAAKQANVAKAAGVVPPTARAGSGMPSAVVAGLLKPGLLKTSMNTPLNWHIKPEAKHPAPAKANPAYSLATGTAGGGTVSTVVANDLKHIASFVAKWHLDTTKAKLALAKLTPPKRQYVMENFTNQAAANKYGTASSMPAITKLEQFIVQCNRTNAWGASASAGAPTGKKVAPVMPALASAIGSRAGQVKRPMMVMASGSAVQANKKPRFGAGGGSSNDKPIPHVVPKYGAGSAKPIPFVVPKHKAAPPFQKPPAAQGQGSQDRSNSWSNSSNASKNSWNDNKSWGSGNSWGSNKQWDKPKAEAQSSGSSIISSLLSKY